MLPALTDVGHPQLAYPVGEVLLCCGVSVGRGTLTLDEHTLLWIGSELPTHERESRGNKMESVCVTNLHWYQSCPNADC